MGLLSTSEKYLIFVDESYPYRDDVGPWFGNLLNVPNTKYLFEADNEKINRWFNVLVDNHKPIEEKLDLLRKEPNYKIRGLNIGFTTLMLYVLDKAKYLIWFNTLHEGLRVIYPGLGKCTQKSAQYIIFNETAKEFAKQYNFEHTELDWILWYLKIMNSKKATDLKMKRKLS